MGPEWVIAKNEAADERGRLYLQRNYDKAQAKIKALEKTIRSLRRQLANKQSTMRRWHNRKKSTDPFHGFDAGVWINT